MSDEFAGSESDPVDATDVEQTWLDEAERRLAAWRRGETTAIPADEVFEGLLTQAQRAELEQRIAEDDANPDDVVPWEQVRRETLARLSR